MGRRSGGGHAFGVVLTARAYDGSEMMEVVDSFGYAIASTPEGPMLTLSDADANIVRQYAPGEWTDILTTLDDDEPLERPSEPL